VLQTVELSTRYDNVCTLNQTCQVNMTIEEKMEGPVYFYYKIVNQYQNHRSYVMDYTITQLQGEAEKTSKCTVDDAKERDGKIIYPCGLIANSM
jgi:hypothetical protein